MLSTKESDANSSLLKGCLDLLEKEMLKLKIDLQQVIFKNRDLKKELAKLMKENDNLFDRCYDMEVELNTTNQYSRRSNVEIRGIPESIQQRDLENHLINVLHSIGINVESYDIVAVHRIGRIVHGKSRNVIARFINRKNAEKATKNSFKLFTSQNASYKKSLFVIICAQQCTEFSINSINTKKIKSSLMYGL